MLGIIIAFAAALGVSFVGLLPLGILNLTAIYVGIRHSCHDLLQYSLGVSVVILGYALVALFANDWIMRYEGLRIHIEAALVPIFLLLAIYFFLQKPAAKSEGNAPSSAFFFRGVALSAINPLAIPFWIVLSNYLFSLGWFENKLLTLSAFALGATGGSFAAMMFFGQISERIAQRIHKLDQMIGKVLGLIFSILALVQIGRLVLS